MSEADEEVNLDGINVLGRLEGMGNAALSTIQSSRSTGESCFSFVGWISTSCSGPSLIPSITTATGSAEPGGRDENRLEVHNERATVFIDGRPDGVEKTMSKIRLEGGVFAG